MGLATPLRRLPLQRALATLRASEGSHKLSTEVAGIAVTFRPDGKNEPGPINFLSRWAPRIAYANPTLPFLVNRIPMPFKPSRSEYKPNVDPNAPTTEEEITRRAEAEAQVPSLTVSFHSKPSQTFELNALTAPQIWARVADLAGAPKPQPQAEADAEPQPQAQPQSA
ncbi:hypothetical protein CcaverHIS002_0603090 [Cutaneotrichosporon cavernicola]|uniref:Ribosomal protein/NADH dehydrogenase domain-containing protein n=1 Tax=Cutaneotrichosporon cavernicola TaxID=279322 RepID=A0AA48QXV9_9TREE|nr:uncharacterized protein CcaverHIS019_0602560 [Cutaneotrichosporon cavernicola]BEI86022.1 hypothetical protein CcaverHIS002_0603090 [Cutaneotrichosporon cavernicola]BEI93797.1 hypothetical protein CcaverHIS019_0602560 [Cutaneotrichosporon cavernicola]BEJ01574.1 hypothetical protein CcaverHIS631_0602560 [Cutaneotrichosporon cavernicola]BEJ09340.1 hypothetical protein CcaverHIS641_0602550 [Cutaneotrichosporon cavernicola]